MGTHPANIVAAMEEVLNAIEPHCSDTETIAALKGLLLDRDRWKDAHGLFQTIRAKTNLVKEEGNDLAEAQYCFEEICAKTIYNLSGEPAPFDADSAFWVLPLAIGLCRKLGFKNAGQVSSLLLMKS